MEFWIFLDVIISVMSSCTLLLNENTNKLVLYIILSIILFISFFRYNIGGDYSSYVTMYELVDPFDELPYPEPSFKYIAYFLRLLGFDYQMLFIVYSCIFFFFFIKGLKKYTNSNSEICIAILFFMVDMKFGGFFWTSSAIRMFAAVAICFWGYQYVIQRKFFKYILVTIVAANFHISALIAIIFYFLPRSLSGTGYFSFLVISFFIGMMPLDLLFSNISEFLLRGSTYVIAGERGTLGEGFGIVYMYIVVIFSIILMNNKNPKNIYAVTMLVYGLALHFIFIKINVLSYRLPLYGYSFMYIAVMYSVINLKINQIKKVIIIWLISVLLIVMQLWQLQNEYNYLQNTDSRPSAGNYHYQFNFKILR